MKYCIDDGGPAFPSEQNETQDGTWNQTYAPGMSLRDYFAAAALAGILCNEGVFGAGVVGKDVTNQKNNAVYRSYEFADAMLAARNKRGE